MFFLVEEKQTLQMTNPYSAELKQSNYCEVASSFDPAAYSSLLPSSMAHLSDLFAANLLSRSKQMEAARLLFLLCCLLALPFSPKIVTENGAL